MRVIRSIIFISGILFIITLFSPNTSSSITVNKTDVDNNNQYNYEEIVTVLEKTDLTEEQILEIESSLKAEDVKNSVADYIKIFNKGAQGLIKKYFK